MFSSKLFWIIKGKFDNNWGRQMFQIWTGFEWTTRIQWSKDCRNRRIAAEYCRSARQAARNVCSAAQRQGPTAGYYKHIAQVLNLRIIHHILPLDYLLGRVDIFSVVYYKFNWNLLVFRFIIACVISSEDATHTHIHTYTIFCWNKVLLWLNST